MPPAVYHASESDTWLTPRSIADRLGRVALDPCSHPRSLVDADLRAMGPEVDGVDGLELPWHEADGVVFVNPPYSTLGAWLAKCAAESDLGAIVVALVPARVDTAAFHSSVIGRARIGVLAGRLRFAIPVEEIDRKLAGLGPVTKRERLERMRANVDASGVCHVTESAPFPTVLLHWHPGPLAREIEAPFGDLGKWIG